MKLALRIVLTFVVTMLLALSATSLVTAKRELASVEADVANRHSDMGRVLRAGFRDVWNSHGKERALSMIAFANTRIRKLEMRWVGFDEGREPRLPQGTPEDLARVLHGTEVHVLVPDRDRLVSYMPFVKDDVTLGAIELDESMTEQRAMVQGTVRNVFLGAALAAVIAGGLVTAAAFAMVGRPIQRLMEQARRIGAGDFSTPIHIRKGDEVSALAEEMNTMSARLAESQRKLADEAAARLRALEELRHVDRLRTVGTLASGMAHELGTPLSVVALRARAVARGAASGDAAQEAGRIIVEQTERMTTLIRRLLEFARRRPPRRADVDLQEVARRTVVLLDGLAKKRGVTVHLEEDGSTVAVRGDALQLEQVLTNLIMNAIQASPAGLDVRIRVGSENVTPPPAVGGSAGTFARVDVADQGSGISDDVLPRIFEPFFTTKDVGEGTGLGLSMAYGITRDHGGWIDVRTRAGHGSTFSIFVPPEAPS